MLDNLLWKMPALGSQRTICYERCQHWALRLAIVSISNLITFYDRHTWLKTYLLPSFFSNRDSVGRFNQMVVSILSLLRKGQRWGKRNCCPSIKTVIIDRSALQLHFVKYVTVLHAVAQFRSESPWNLIRSGRYRSDVLTVNTRPLRLFVTLSCKPSDSNRSDPLSGSRPSIFSLQF